MVLLLEDWQEDKLNPISLKLSDFVASIFQKIDQGI